METLVLKPPCVFGLTIGGILLGPSTSPCETPLFLLEDIPFALMFTILPGVGDCIAGENLAVDGLISGEYGVLGFSLGGV
jgi:hypothetical protein